MRRFPPQIARTRMDGTKWRFRETKKVAQGFQKPSQIGGFGNAELFFSCG